MVFTLPLPPYFAFFRLGPIIEQIDVCAHLPLYTYHFTIVLYDLLDPLFVT